MATWTIKINQNEFKKIKYFYKFDNSFKLPNKNLILFIKTKNLTISIFKTMTLLLQGNENDILNFKKKIFNNYSKLTKTNNWQKQNIVDGYIGMDEVGTGDYFGPIVTCACYLKNDNINKVKLLHAKDSKKIVDKQIPILAKKIAKYVNYEVSICMPKKYNELIDKFNNINIIKTIFHNESIAKLVKRLNKNKYLIVLDQYVQKQKYYEYLNKAKIKPIKIDIMETKAESKYLSVACASIIARNVFLTKMNELSNKINIFLPKGAAEKAKIIKIGKLINKKTKINEYAKLNFASITNEIIN